MRGFHRRDAAVAWADARGRLPVWAEDKPPGNGEQRFWVASRAEFERRVGAMPVRVRHFYEILRPDAPTHLYLDVEYDRALNPTLGDVGPAVDEAVRRAFRVLYDLEEVDPIELDASDARKFSRHMIYRARDGRMFADPFHCGAFARRISIFPEARVAGGGVASVVDLGVYTKWRAFRCATSSKMRAPDRPFVRLRPSRASFAETLTQSEAPPSGLLECSERDGSAPASGRGPRAILDDSLPLAPEPSERFFRALAAEIEDFWRDGSVAFVRHDPADAVALFSSDSRWCGLKGDEHSKNHVYFVADLRRGAWRQACHNRTRESCCRRDPETGEAGPRWGDWKLFARAAEAREFAARSVALRDEFLELLDRVERGP